MGLDRGKHHRRSIRLKGYDNTQAGAYFVTTCTQNGEMRLNDAGRMMQMVWDELPGCYPDVDVDAFTLVPNQIDGIISPVYLRECWGDLPKTPYLAIHEWR